jgi:hypothetical protein
MFEPITCAGPDPRDFEDGRNVVLVVNPVEFGLEVLRDIHLNNVNIGHGGVPSVADLLVGRLAKQIEAR